MFDAFSVQTKTSKMHVKVIVFLLSTLTISKGNAAVLLWSNNKLEISPLNEFTDATLDDLVEKMGYPELTIYKSPSSLLPEFEGFLDGYYTAFNPNGDISTENATEISGRDDLVLLQTKPSEYNILSVLVVANERHKREASGTSTTEGSSFASQGPVLYRGRSNKGIYSLLYSSQPLLIRTGNATFEVGEGRTVTVDAKNQVTKLHIKAVEENTVNFFILQFYFVRTGGYWSLPLAKFTRTDFNSSGVYLNITEPFSVPTSFSYHCGGETVFTDPSNTVELVVYDMQAQMESTDGAFSDAYDCVDFTTAPIWSGLFVTALLGVGLIVALVAISEIKTMDKFDNQKTKQLAITVAE